MEARSYMAELEMKGWAKHDYGYGYGYSDRFAKMRVRFAKQRTGHGTQNTTARDLFISYIFFRKWRVAKRHGSKSFLHAFMPRAFVAS